MTNTIRLSGVLDVGYAVSRHPFLAAAGLVLCVLVMLWPSASAEYDAPAELQARIDQLDAPQRAFITSGKVLEFIPQHQLEHELATRDGQSLAELFTELLALAAEMGYDPTRDMGAAPLNLESKQFHRGMVTTPPGLREPKRDAGPFSVHRYLFPMSGVPTFGGAKVAIWPEDLVAGKVEVAIVGVLSNMSSGRRDAIAAPDQMRAINTIATTDVLSLVKPFEALSVVDYGNFNTDRLAIERSVRHVSEMVAETAATGAIPMLVGGDTSILYPSVMGVAQARKGARFGLLHFSAHPDIERTSDHTISDRQAVFRLIDQSHIAGRDTIQVGLRGPDIDADSLRWLQDNNVRYHTMAEIQKRGVERVMQRVIKEVDRGPDAFFVSIDVSAIDPAEMIAAGRIASNGLDLAIVINTIRHVCAAKQIVGFEITDLAPMMDLSRQSVLSANAVLNACLNGIAVRKSGLKPDYVHPLARDHGQR